MALTQARIRRLRASIPALKGQIYVNWGGSGPSPAAVLCEVTGVLEREAALGPFHPRVREAAAETAAALRASAADLLGARPGEIALAGNTTGGVNVAAGGLEWKAGDEVIISDLEHPGGYLPWLLWRDRAGIRVRLLRTEGSDDELLTRLEAAMGPRTRAVSLSHIAWLTGRRLPVEEIGRLCRRAGALYVLDGAQSVGQIAVDVKRIRADVYTLSGQKWLMGPQGTGAVYVRRGLRKTVRETAAGYRTARRKRLETLTFEPHAEARRFEVATISPALFRGLGAAVEICRKSGPAAIEKRVLKLSDALLAALRECKGVEVLCPPGPAQSGLVAFRVGGMKAETVAARLLKKSRVVLRAVDSEPPAVRASIHYLNTGEEIDRIGEAVRALARGGRKRG